MRKLIPPKCIVCGAIAKYFYKGQHLCDEHMSKKRCSLTDMLEHVDSKRGHRVAYLYFIGVGDPHNLVKIGVSCNVSQRLDAICALSPIDVSLWGAIACKNKRDAYTLESTFHILFENCLHHNEWYAIKRDYIDELLAYKYDELKYILRDTRICCVCGYNKPIKSFRTKKNRCKICEGKP